MPLPIVQPIIPRLSRRLPIGRGWRYEVKLDGFRGTLYIEKDRARFRSKTMRVMKRFESLAESLVRSIEVRDAIFDGEIIVMREQKPDFYALMFRRRQPEYAAFDLLWLNGRDLRERRYVERKKLLHEAINQSSAIGYVDDYNEPEVFTAAARLDLEGVVAKRSVDTYEASTEWLKIKHPGYSQAEGRHEFFQRAK